MTISQYILQIQHFNQKLEVLFSRPFKEIVSTNQMASKLFL